MGICACGKADAARLVEASGSSALEASWNVFLRRPTRAGISYILLNKTRLDRQVTRTHYCGYLEQVVQTQASFYGRPTDLDDDNICVANRHGWIQGLC